VHILFLTDNFPPEVNASATRVYERACYWVRSGHQVTVVTCFPNFPQGKVYPGYRQRLYRREVIDGITVIRLPTYVARNAGTVRRTLDFVSFMLSVVLAIPWLPRSSVVVATSPQFFAAVAGWIVSVVKRAPFVFELGDLWPASISAVGAIRKGVLLRAIEKVELFLYRRAAAVIALTAAFKANLVSRGIPTGKIAVVVNGVDLQRYSPRPRDTELARTLGLEGAFVAGYVGTFGMAHDLANAIRASAALQDEPAFRLLLVGDGAERPKLQQLVSGEGIRNVVFVPSQPKHEMPRYWSLCDVALVHLKDDPVFAEVIPSKIFEAMAMGLPLLLVAPAGEATKIIERESAGLCAPPGEPAAMAAALSRLMKEESLRTRLAAQSLVASRRYTRERQAIDTMKVLERVVAGEGARAALAVD
jgi:colanic acid biosynthesis glycosyl transferase WcaI